MDLPTPSLTGLPAELLSAVFSYLPAKALLAVGRTCRQFHEQANEPILWRQHCLKNYASWDSRHSLESKRNGPIQDTDWKRLYRKRAELDWENLELLNAAISQQKGRMSTLEEIAKQGVDAKDLLIRNSHLRIDKDDGLARNHWSSATLACVNRTEAIQMWSHMSQGTTEFSLEEALSGLDMFVVGSNKGTIQDIRSMLDELAKDVYDNIPEFDRLTTRTRALEVATWLRTRGYRGVPSERYSNLQNSFLSRVLQHPEHEALPLTQVVIYSAICQRLGINSRPCGFPFHIYGIVIPPGGETLDGKPVGDEPYQDKMYVDPFRNHEEISEADLKARLRQIGSSPALDNVFLGEASPRDIVLRAARNIMKSLQDGQHRRATDDEDEAAISDSAFYGTLWAMMLLNRPQDEQVMLPAQLTRRQTYLPYILKQLQSNYLMDVHLFETYALPLFCGHGIGQVPRLPEMVSQIRQNEVTDPDVIRRTLDDGTRVTVMYRVGQVFRHRRYGYLGAITGWDPKCHAREEWIRRMEVDELPGGRDQSFYHIMADDRTTRYVAEENIMIEQPFDPPKSLLPDAGKFFKRWDYTKAEFVSNVKDVYPDD